MKKIYTLLASMALLMAVGMVKVNAQVVDVCAGNDTVELRLGNFQYGYVQWQVSDDIETWFDIDGAIDTVYRFLPERPRYYRAEVHFPACMENDYYSQVSYVQIPPKAFAGPDMSIPAGTVARLCASSFKGAEGEWHIIEGTNGLIENASNPKSGFIGEEGEYKLTWTVINSCGSNTDTVTVRCVRMEYQPNIVYVDETDAILSDSTQLVNGEYVIVFSDPAPDIQVGSVLLGYRVPSFLRKVVSFEREGDLYVMQTEQGVLTDILLSGALFFDPIGDIEGGGRSSVKYIDRYPTRKEMLDNPFMLRDGSTYLVRGLIPDTAQKGEDWEATVTVEDGVLTLVLMMNLGLFNDDLDGLIYRGTVSLEPNMRSNIFPEEGQLTECYLGCYDAVFSHTESLSIDKALSAVDVGGHGSINPSPIIFPFAIGGVPIVVSMDFPVSFKVSAALDGLNLSFTSSTTFTSAIEYDPETHEFNKIFEKQEPMETPGEFDLTGTLGMNFQAGMKFSILIAGVVGPYAEWRATVNPSICVSSLPPYHANADLKVGLDMDLGVRFHLFKDLLESDVCFNFPLYERVEHAPNSVNKYLGDNQVYSFGNYLTTPITVDVEGWFGSKLPLAKIYFEPEIGGEVTDPVASTDIHGKASTRWRPNSPTGRDKLRVKAFDCHGNLIGGTPVVFHAYSSATDPCINSDLTVEVYHVQEDRIIPLVRGESPFLYSTDGESFSSTVPNIQTQPGHNYTFYVQDKNGCEAMTTYNEPFYDCENSSLMLSVTASGNVITATGHFGIDPYEFSIDGINYQPTGLFGVQLDGEYTVFVRDALGCVDTKHVTVSREGNLYVWISEINGHSGTAEVMASSGSLAERGVCWSTHHAPTVEDLHASFGPGTGVFPFTINGLDPETTYYVRAYALDLSGTSYSEERCINPSNGVYLPEVAATGITSIAQTSAVGSGNVTYDGGAEVTERGICWGTNHNPDLTGMHIPCGAGTGSFTGDITGLAPNTLYYARAYATNSEGTAYGVEVEFFTGNGGGNEAPEGAINGLFSVSEGKQVYFSRGNLQYQASTNIWKFAEHQWDYVGEDNINISSTYDGWIDLFGWGTSGYNHGAYCYHPWERDDERENYFAYGNKFKNLYDMTGQADWGYNSIINGGNQENQWFTLSQLEWDYVLNTRQTESGIRYAKGTVNGVKGLILLPDNLIVSYYPLSDVNPTSYNSSFDCNNISIFDWISILEEHGAVFLPASGYRRQTLSSVDCQILGIGSNCYYWTASCGDGEFGDSAYELSSILCSISKSPRDNGLSVRLVQGTQPDPPLGNLPQVTIGIIDISSSIVTCTCNVFSDESTIIERGICWGTNHNPSLHHVCGGGAGTFTTKLINLRPDTHYFVRAYATNSNGTAYGEELEFTTIGNDGNHEWVDLGLPSGTLWANSNVGASTPEEYGNYFAWGETQPKQFYNGSNYQNNNDFYNSLLPENDAATVNWGSGWCIPTKIQWEELYENTNSTWVTQNGVNGRVFTASNGNSIFLPAAGYGFYDKILNEGDFGYSWSNLFVSETGMAWEFFINSDYFGIDEGPCQWGNSVRPVRSTSPSAQLPQVIFGPIVTVGTDANIIGVVVSDGGAEVTDRGVCWSTSPNPNISGNHISAGAGVGDFSVIIQGLEFGTTYYVRAYATNSVGTAYSNEESFTPTQGGGPVTPDPPEGAIDGLFSVAPDYQVFFSQGNLQYQASTNTWKFAENQWDYVGEDNNNISPTYNGWIDLFGWGTSGYNHGAVSYQPWCTSLGASDYLAYGNADYNLFDQTGQADWGYNAISNGGDTENQWRTLTESEWDYVLNMRNTTSGIRYALATVNGVKGLILISDLWQDSNYSLSNPNTMDTTFDNNVIDAVTWEYQFEGAGGCVFLPAAGERYGIGVAYVGTFGLYWSSNNKPEWGDYYASYFDFAQWGEPYPGVWSSNREYGFAVRLVQDAPNGSGSGNGGGGRK